MLYQSFSFKSTLGFPTIGIQEGMRILVRSSPTKLPNVDGI